MAMMANLISVPVTIAAGQSLSDALNLSSKSMVTIAMPAQWQMAELTFEMSVDGATFYSLCYATTGEVILPVFPGVAIIVPKEMSDACNYIKFRSGTARRPVPQPVDRVFGVATTP